jgi:hypothetical protein
MTRARPGRSLPFFVRPRLPRKMLRLRDGSRSSAHVFRRRACPPIGRDRGRPRRSCPRGRQLLDTARLERLHAWRWQFAGGRWQRHWRRWERRRWDGRRGSRRNRRQWIELRYEGAAGLGRTGGSLQRSSKRSGSPLRTGLRDDASVRRQQWIGRGPSRDLFHLHVLPSSRHCVCAPQSDLLFRCQVHDSVR